MCCSLFFTLSEEDDKDDEEDDEDEKDLDHQPAVGGDWLEVFEDLCVSAVHVQLGVFNVSVNPEREARERDLKTNAIRRLLVN